MTEAEIRDTLEQAGFMYIPEIQTVEHLVPGAHIMALRRSPFSAGIERGTVVTVDERGGRDISYMYGTTRWAAPFRNFFENFVVISSPVTVMAEAPPPQIPVFFDEQVPLPFIADRPRLEVPECVPVPKVFKPMEWIDQLCSQTGVRKKDLTGDLLPSMLAMDNKADINKLFFEYSSSLLNPQELGPDDKQFFKSIITIENSEQYQASKQEVSRLQGLITRQYTDIESKAELLIREQRKMRSMKLSDEKDLTPDIEKIISDGWYKYDRAFTVEYNMHKLERDHIICFTTPEVVITHVNEPAGINMKVNLGSYRVVYIPQRNKIKVQQHLNNIVVDEDEDGHGFIHPHVHTNGDVCWGNAGSVHSRAMVEHTPSKSLLALRTLLQTYNDESPYRDLLDFAVQRNPDIARTVPPRFRLTTEADCGADPYVWIFADDMPSGVDGTFIEDTEFREDDDGEDYECNKISVFRKYIAGTDQRVESEDIFYIKLRNGSYHRVETYLETD